MAISEVPTAWAAISDESTAPVAVSAPPTPSVTDLAAADRALGDLGAANLGGGDLEVAHGVRGELAEVDRVRGDLGARDRVGREVDRRETAVLLGVVADVGRAHTVAVRDGQLRARRAVAQRVGRLVSDAGHNETALADEELEYFSPEQTATVAGAFDGGETASFQAVAACL
jgi:hypothetical protein